MPSVLNNCLGLAAGFAKILYVQSISIMYIQFILIYVYVRSLVGQGVRASALSDLAARDDRRRVGGPPCESFPDLNFIPLSPFLSLFLGVEGGRKVFYSTREQRLLRQKVEVRGNAVHVAHTAGKDLFCPSQNQHRI